MVLPKPVTAWAARPGSAALLAAVRAKLEHGRVGDGVRVPVAEESRDDVGRMLGLDWELSGRPVTLGRLRESLAGADVDLVDLLTATGGALRDLPSERRQSKSNRQQLQDRVTATLTRAGIPADVADVAVRRRWLGSDLATAAKVADQVARAWVALPTSLEADQPAGGRGTGLAEFAGQVLGDPHALDRDSAAGRAIVRLAAASLAVADLSDELEQVTDHLELAAEAAANVLRAARWRSVWSRLGITCDQVSSTVLVLNVPLQSANPSLFQISATPGEPVWVSARMTAGGCSVASGLGADEGLTVLVCENPSVMEAAADSFGSSCPPLVCLYGRPSGAAWAVLSAVVAAGGVLRVSSDRDPAGKQIAAEVTARFGGDHVSGWVTEAEGIYEEERLEALMIDLAERRR